MANNISAPMKPMGHTTNVRNNNQIAFNASFCMVCITNSGRRASCFGMDIFCKSI